MDTEIKVPSQWRIRSTTRIVAAIAAIAVLGYWGYGAYREHETRKALVTMLKDTSQRLSDAFRNEAEAQLASIPDTVGKLEARAAQIDRYYSTVRRMESSAAPELREAAEDYLLTAREIMRRVAAIHRSRMVLSESRTTLVNHMRSDRGGVTWPGEAVRARERVEHDFREFGLASGALARLLESFPASQAKIAPYVEKTLLIDENLVKKARARLLASLKQTGSEVDKITNLDAYR